MGADQHAFEDTVRVGVEIDPILEGAGLALVRVHGHEARAGLADHRAPFASRGKARASEPAQAAVIEFLEQRLARHLARADALQELVAASRHIGVVVHIAGRDMRMGVVRLDRGFDGGAIGLVQKIMPDLDGGRLVAKPDARSAHDAHRRTRRAGELGKQLLRPEQCAGQAVANANRQRRQVRLALFDDVEMSVEGRRLENLGKGQLHELGERREMCCRNLAVAILDEMQVLDEEIAATRPIPDEGLHLAQGFGIDLPSFGSGLGALSPGARVFEVAHLDGVVVVHCRSAAARRSPSHFARIGSRVANRGVIPGSGSHYPIRVMRQRKDEVKVAASFGRISLQPAG